MANRQNNRRYNQRPHSGNRREFSQRQNFSSGFRHDFNQPDWFGYRQQTPWSFDEFEPHPDQFGMGWGGDFGGQQHIGGYDYADNVTHFRASQRGRGYGPNKRPQKNFQFDEAKRSRKCNNWNNDYGAGSTWKYEDSGWGGGPGYEQEYDYYQGDEPEQETEYYGDFNEWGENYAHEYNNGEHTGGCDDVYQEEQASWSNQFIGNPPTKLGVHEKTLIAEGNQNEKFIYQKHRKMAQNFAGREFLYRVVKSTMHALKLAGDKLSEQLKNEETQTNKADEDATTDLSNGNSQAGDFCENSEANVDDKSLEGTELEQCKKDDHDKLTANSSEKVDKGCPPQVILGVVRVGSAAKRLLNSDSPNNGAELVLLFKCKPTKLHLETICEILKEKIAPDLRKSLEININVMKECIEIVPTSGEHTYTTIVRFSSPLFSKDSADYDTSDDQDDTLSRSYCVDALAKIRRVRWFQKMVNQELEVPIIRILLDMSTRLTGWNKLTVYSAEVLVHTVAQKLSKDCRENEIHASRILTQSLEVLAGGLLLSGGPSLKDPCEKEPVDVFGYLFEQEAEDLTRAAQTALRTVACGNLDELLGLKVS